LNSKQQQARETPVVYMQNGKRMSVSKDQALYMVSSIAQQDIQRALGHYNHQCKTNPRESTQSLLAFCKLLEEPSCFEPHKTGRTVKTLSAAQVKLPIFSRGIDRRKTCEKQLQAPKYEMEKEPLLMSTLNIKTI